MIAAAAGFHTPGPVYGLNGWELTAAQGDMVALAVDIAEGQVASLGGWATQLDPPRS